MTKYKQKKKKMEDEEFNNDLPEARYAFIVFRDMQAVDYLLKAYKTHWMIVWLARSWVGKKFFPKSYERFEKLYFFK